MKFSNPTISDNTTEVVKNDETMVGLSSSGPIGHHAWHRLSQTTSLKEG